MPDESGNYKTRRRSCAIPRPTEIATPEPALVSRSSEQSEEEILPLPLRYTQSQGQNDKGKLGVRMTESEGARNDG